ncbi:hypothetical protein RB16p019 [Escherichia phage RB16]|uniref:Conserved hypothetical phage protein n=1 Tax=Escherichia phage RB16 TaxID=2681599 RepID=D9IC80_BPRB1|nr:hypothetical protein RB16p019 [Escherichia phage RB16]ADJ55323.1 conserved hypothetical phage protein [Escherichia phage RB16]
MFDLKEGFKVVFVFAIIGMISVVSIGLWLSYEAIVWLGEWLRILATR